MIADIVASCAQRISVRRAAALFLRHVALKRAFMYQRAADLGVELVVEPVCKPPHLDAAPRRLRQQTVLSTLRMGFFDIFRDHCCARNWRLSFGDEHRQLSSGVELQKFFPALPKPFFHKAGGNTVLTENQAYVPRTGAERVMKQRQHWRSVWNRPSGINAAL